MFLEKEKFSLWVDFIERDFVKTGMKSLIDQKIINGATSNPAIFKTAFLGSPAYAETINTYKNRLSPKELYEKLAIEDIRLAADALRPLFDQDDDGFVSIEVDPNLAFDAQGTIEEGRRLYAQIERPNVMIKVPATVQGYEAMSQLISEGISVNATLIFSIEEALSCAKAFEKGQALTDKNPHSVISVFVSRFDRKLDDKLPQNMQAKVGIANAAKIYNAVEAMNVKNNRTLFASTGVKGDTLHPAYYVSELIAPNSINTTPLETIESFVNEGTKEVKLPMKSSEIDAVFNAVKEAGIDLDSVMKELKEEGLVAFVDAFKEIMQSLKG